MRELSEISRASEELWNTADRMRHIFQQMRPMNRFDELCIRHLDGRTGTHDVEAKSEKIVVADHIGTEDRVHYNFPEVKKSNEREGSEDCTCYEVIV